MKLDNKDSTDLLTQSNYLATRDYDTVHTVPGSPPCPSFDTSAVKQVLQQLVLDSLTKGQVQCEGI